MHIAEPNARWNYRAFLVDGGAFACGMGFVNSQTLLPAIILETGGPNWLAAFVPSAMALGIFSIPIFTAHIIDRMATVKPFVLKTTIPQRLVFLVAAILLFLPGVNHAWLPWILALTPLLSGLFAGVGISAFQRLYIRGIPQRMRASNVSFRFLIGGVTGVLAGRIVELLLESFTLMTALGILHLIAFLCAVISWIALSQVREEPLGDPEPVARRSWHDLLDGLRDFLATGTHRRDHIYFLLALVLMHAFFIPAPFYANHLKQAANESVAFLGVLGMWFMGGSAIGNLCAAWVGDRLGGRFSMRSGLFCFFLINAIAPFVASSTWVGPLYALFGFSLMLTVVGKEALQFDLSPLRRQARYLATLSFITMLSIFAASLASFILWDSTLSFTVLTWTASGCSAIGFILLGKIREPRSDVQGDLLARIRLGIMRHFNR